MAALERYNPKTITQRIGNDSVYGTGSDSNVVISSNVALNRDMYYNNLTVNTGFHLNTNGFKVFVKGSLTVNGSIGIGSTNTVGLRTNLFTNPSVETVISGWNTAHTIVRSTDFAYSGVASAKTTILSSTTDSNVIYFTLDVPLGDVTFSLYLYTPTGSTIAGRTITFAREGGTATSTVVSGSPATLIAGQWVRTFQTRNVTTAGTIIFVGRLSGTITGITGQLIYSDGLLLEQGAVVGSYFDSTIITSGTLASRVVSANTTSSIGGNAFGGTYTASQLPTAIVQDISTAILGYYIDTTSNTKIITGGAGGGNGSAGVVTSALAGTVTPGFPGAVFPGLAGGSPAGYMAAPTDWHNRTNTYGYHATSAGPSGNYSPGLTGQGTGYPGGPGPAGTPGTNGAAGTTPTQRAGGTIAAAAAGSTPAAATAGVAGGGGALVIIVAKAITGTGSILSQGINATAGGPAATGTGAGPAATSTNAQTSATGTGATNAAAGVTGHYAPAYPLHHGTEGHAHWNRTVAPAHHVAQTSGALGRTGHQAAKASDHAHGHGSHTSHGATPVHPHNSHGGSNPSYGAAAVGYAAVPAVSGYFHKNSVDHTAGGHLGHNGAVAHPYTFNSGGHHGAHGFVDAHYHETDNHTHHVPAYTGGFPDVHFPAYEQPVSASRPRYDARHHHTQGVYAQAGTDAYHTSGTWYPGLPGPGGFAGTPGTNGYASAGTNASTTAGTNGSTTAGSNGQSGGGGGIIIVTDAVPSGVTTNASGGTVSGNTASSGSVITIINT